MQPQRGAVPDVRTSQTLAGAFRKCVATILAIDRNTIVAQDRMRAHLPPAIFVEVLGLDIVGNTRVAVSLRAAICPLAPRCVIRPRPNSSSLD